jgi:hypothetical protein
MKLLNSTILILILSALTPSAKCSDHEGVYTDLQGDAVVRRTDLGQDAPLPAEFEPIDLLEIRVEGWETPTPTTDQYNGSSTGGDATLMRLQIRVDGLVAPPGPIGLDASPYAPYLFGDRPIFGYIELDVDDQKNSGGEFMPLAQNRYLANVGRFGSSPFGSISDRMVRNAAEDLDSNFSTSPQFERTGGEFALALCGCFTPSIVSQDGNMDSSFDQGESWIVSGRFFERFVAFAPESGLFGGSDFGFFDPIVELQFKHDIALDQTTITLIFPVTNEGAAELLGQSEQSIDLNITNQTSIEEALDDLIIGADFTTGNLNVLTSPWEGRQTDDYYRPRDWGVTALIGTAPLTKDPTSLFVWTDTGFDEVHGDLDDDGLVTASDTQIIEDSIALLDGTASDADGMVDGDVEIVDFGPNFDLRDLNGDGIISDDDILAPDCPADLTGEGSLNFLDVSAFLSAYSATDPAADFVVDGQFNFLDVSAFLGAYSAGCP